MEKLSTKEKSVKINIHSEYYGTIAEIGGGQETARHLFQAGGASNTIAKSVSAYDKRFSDYFYNNEVGTRYVAEERLRKMIDYEYTELIKILDKKNKRKFFAFANTVEVLNFNKTNLGNGWLGIAFEGSDRYNPNKFFIHIKLHENDTLLQQYTLGTLGINLIYAGLFYQNNSERILMSLLDNLDTTRVEVDYVYADGANFTVNDNRLLNLLLVRLNMTPAVLFDSNGHVKQAGDMLYKKNVLLMRGYFRPINRLGMEFIEHSLDTFKRDEDYTPENTIAFCEISLNYLIKNEELDEADFMHRIDLLNLMGQSVMISKYTRYFELVDFFKQFKLIKLRLVIGLPTFTKILDSTYYSDLKGGLLEALGAIFQENVKVYLYPDLNSKTKAIVFPNDYYFEGKQRLLWQYLNMCHSILVLSEISDKYQHITNEKVNDLIIRKDDQLNEYIPDEVVSYIKKHKLFGYE